MDRFPETKVKHRIYPDTKISLGRKTRKPDLSLEAAGNAARLAILVV